MFVKKGFLFLNSIKFAKILFLFYFHTLKWVLLISILFLCIISYFKLDDFYFRFVLGSIALISICLFIYIVFLISGLFILLKDKNKMISEREIYERFIGK